MKLYDSVFYFISGHGRGWAFSSNDLIKKFERQQIDNVLSDLVKAKKIRRVSRGIYDYPKYSELLQKELSPDIEQVARAIGRTLFQGRDQATRRTHFPVPRRACVVVQRVCVDPQPEARACGTGVFV